MDQVKSNFFENQILEAIETVANGIVSKLQFDQTILCTITSDNKRKNGEYEVSNGSSTFKAFSSDTNYKKDMAVYVLVPQGDFERQKTIVGKYVDDTASAINYIPASQSIIEVAKIEIPQDEFSLLANGENKLINIIDSDWNNTNIYDCVSLKANFKTDLSKYNIIDGDYGLMLTLKGYQVKSETKEDGTLDQTIIEIAPKFYKFSCKDMFGDPYNYNIYFDQDIVFDLSENFADIKINHYRLDFYQNGKFKDLSGEDIPYRDIINDVDFNNNLFVKDIQMSFGYSTVDIKEEGIQIYTPDNLKYIDRLPKKNIVLKWFQKNEVGSNTAYGIIDTLDEAKEKNYSVYWYRYRIGASEDELAGAFWELLDAGAYNDNINYEYELVEDPHGKYAYKGSKLILADSDNAEEKRYRMKIKTTPGTGRYENEISTSNPYNISFAPDKLLNREKIKAILVKYEFEEIQEVDENDSNIVYITFKLSPKIYESNEIIFENANPASLSLAAVDLIRNMRLECQDGSNGIYKVYNSVDNKALGNEANRIRILNVIFDTYSTIDIPTAELENCSVKWKIPKNNSMIEPVDFSFTGPVVIQNPNNENKIKGDNESETTIITWKTENSVPYYECSYSWSSDIVGKDEHYEGVSLQANYRIKEDYSQAYNNNTIICEITKYNRIYKAEIEFLFGESGTNGTGYTLSIRLDKEYDSTGNVSLTPVSCITADTNKKVKLVATLFDQFGNDISDQQTVSWNFKNGINKGLVLDSDYIKYDETEVISECYGIVMATSTVKWKEKIINLQAYLPIGIKPKDSDIFTYNGTTKIIYDAQGTQSTYQQIHNLYDKEDKDIPVNKWQVSVLDQGVNEDWSEYIPYFVKEITQDSTETTEDSKKTTNILAAKNMYFTELSTKQIVIQALDDKDNVLYQQSILYDQNRFGSALFNEWDGSLIVDEAGNKILSALIGAGKKDNNNTFTGVVMGKTTTNSGLIGYSKGVQTFGFDTDGTAFIGASGKGRIEFNGTTGTIQSGNYKQTKEGIKIDLDDGKFELNPTKILKTQDDLNGQEESNFINNLQSAYIQINTNKDPYFEIKTISSIKKDENDEYIYETIDDKQYLTYNYTPLIFIGNNTYYLQSKNFSDTDKTGVKLDLGDGKFELNPTKILKTQDDLEKYGEINLINSLQSAYIQINTNKEPYFEIKTISSINRDKNDKPIYETIDGKKYLTYNYTSLISIGKNKYYLQSKNFSDTSTSKTGVKLDLNSGKLYGYDFLIQAGQGDKKLIIDSDSTSNPLTIGTNFKVGWDGKMEATGGTFKDITASSGKIGGWTIVSNALYYGNKDGHQFNETTNYLTSFKTGVNRAFFAPGGVATTNFKYSTTTYEVTTDDEGEYTGTKTDNNNNSLDSSVKILFNVGQNFAIAVDGTVYANALYLKDYAKTKDLITLSNNAFAGINKNISSIGSINNEINDMNKQYGSIIKVSGTDKTNTYMTKGGSYDGVTSGYFFEGNFYSDAEHKTLMNKKNNYVYVDISTGDTYSCKSSKYTKNNDIKFFTVSTEGLLTANNAVISGTIYATNGWFSGGITASEGHFGNWQILPSGELKGTPSSNKAGYEIILNPNYIEDSNEKKTIQIQINGTTINFEIAASDSVGDIPKNFEAAVRKQTENNSFSWNNLPPISQTILIMQFIYIKTLLVDSNIFKIKNTDSNMIFGIDGNGFLNWRFYNDTFTSEHNRFIIRANSDSLNIIWMDWTKENIDHQAAWSFTSDGSLNLSKLKSTSYKDDLGGFQLQGEDASDKFWNNSLFTTNTINTASNKYSHYVGFLRAVGSSSQSLTNTFIGCKQYNSINDDTWPSNDNWSSSDAYYNFYICFDGKAKFKTLSTDTLSTDTLSTDTLSTKRINAAIPGIDTSDTKPSQGRDYALIKLTSSSDKYLYYRPLFSLQGGTKEKTWDFGINPRRKSLGNSKYQYTDELFLCGFSSYAYSNSGDASFSLGIGRKWDTNVNNDGSDPGYNYIVPRTNIKLGTSNFPWKEIWSVNELNTSSDIRLKEVQDDNYLRKLLIVYNNIKPIAYKKKNIKPEDNHDRIHIGFSAQNVELELSKVSLTSMDFAGLGIDPTNDPFFEDGKQYSLRYGEFHGLHVLKNQEQDKRILELEQKVQYLENKILELSEKGV